MHNTDLLVLWYIVLIWNLQIANILQKPNRHTNYQNLAQIPINPIAKKVGWYTNSSATG